MIVLGLTGSIGMGKSTVANRFRELNITVADADAIVHRLLEKDAGGAVKIAFPEAVKDGGIQRKTLGDIVFHDDAKRKILEGILHPLVVAEEERIAKEEQKKDAKIVVLEIPLLYETGAEKRCDKVVVVSASEETQRLRVMERAGMTEEKFRRILALQMPDAEKRKRADFVVNSDAGHDTLEQVKQIVQALCAK